MQIPLIIVFTLTPLAAMRLCGKVALNTAIETANSSLNLIEESRYFP
jgi:hypothetical protein